MIRRLILAAAVVVTFGSVGCSTARLYDGPALDSEETAKISGQSAWDPFGGFHGTAVYSLDGVEFDGRKRKIEIQPGVHSVGLVSSWLWWTEERVTVEQEFEAGKTYPIGIQQGFGTSRPTLMSGQ